MWNSSGGKRILQGITVCLVSLKPKRLFFGLSVQSKLAVVLFSGHYGFLPQVKKKDPAITLA